MNEDKDKIYAYIAGIIKDTNSYPLIRNGTEDHLHIFCVLSKNITVSKIVQHIKSNSSKRIKNISGHYAAFSWQTGYGAFSVSPFSYDKVIEYIRNQKKHHKKRNSREEYILFLKRYNIEFA